MKDRPRQYQKQISGRPASVDYRVACGNAAVDFDGYLTRGNRGVLLDAKFWQPYGMMAQLIRKYPNRLDADQADILFNATIGSLNKQAAMAHQAGLDLEWHFAFREARDLLVWLCTTRAGRRGGNSGGWRVSGRDRHGRWVDLTHGHLRVRLVHTPVGKIR